MHKNKDYGLTTFIANKKIESNNIGRIIKQTNHTYTVATISKIVEHSNNLIRYFKEAENNQPLFIIFL